MPRTIAATLLALLVALAAPCQAPDGRQVHWQRTLADALDLQAATGRPILVALNMDGESASDRIVHENYRDPAFVAASRSCICLVGSLFRHTPRDHDDEGRRIPCPRLGHVTCGEHIALEPLLFERFLADGERVAPRHALVLPDVGIDERETLAVAKAAQVEDHEHDVDRCQPREEALPLIGMTAIRELGARALTRQRVRPEVKITTVFSA